MNPLFRPSRAKLRRIGGLPGSYRWASAPGAKLGISADVAAGQGSATNDEIESLIAVLVAVGRVMPALREGGRRLCPFVLLAQNRHRHARPDVVDSAMERLAAELCQLIGKIQAGIRDFKYPFDHARGSITVAEYARYEKPCTHEFERVFQDANAHVERLFALHYRLVGRMLLAAARAEDELELEHGRTGADFED